ncbi:TetR/AcrR family transcriptional regulator [Streptomyces poonensis]|uniref:TetR family transcriptional regulator n=1 Tax=Streptomyces poonensis TaxID=68255 RepID=A0A918PBE9_9ACTN|nr:TetR/AcrR family transcriptional regulator [Streptomyces poonensis]GGY97829.1 TetR family transcriptional regulator [Streptomyces poonensis]
MVGRILDAGGQVLAEHGYEGASTSRIAAAAGISPGSLYQYFPHKDAIVLSVLERYSDTLVSSVTARMTGQFEQPAPVIVRSTLATLLDGLDVAPPFLRAAVEHGPRLDDGRALRAFEERIGELVLAYLTTQRPGLRPDTPLDTAVWMLVRTVEHLTVRYLLDRPPIPRERFLTELTHLALNYLRPTS